MVWLDTERRRVNSTMTTYDYSSLDDSPTTVAPSPGQLPPSNKKYILVIGAFVFVSIIVNFVLIQGFFERTRPVTFDSIFPLLVVNAIFATVITDVYIQQRLHVAEGRRLLKFAEMNNLELMFDETPSTHVGAIFRVGFDRLVRSGLRSNTEGRRFELGTYRHVIGHGRGARSYRYTFLMIETTHLFPAMLFHNRQVKRWQIFGQISWFVRDILRKLVLANPAIMQRYKVYATETGVSGDHALQLGAIDTILQQYADQYSFETNHNKLYVYKRGADGLSKQATLQKWLKLADELTRQLG